MKRPIAIGLSPNTQKDDVLLALRLLFLPWRYIRGDAPKELERWFRTFFKIDSAISFVNARSALYAILHCLEINPNDEVILQAFTCVAVPNAIIATGAKPVYVDIDDTLNINPTKLERKITNKTRAIIVQHTFGIPADMSQIIPIAKKYKIPIIEDCAHTIGGEYKRKKLGTFGDAACFSFGRDKAFSSVFGGMAITSDKSLSQKLRAYQKQKNYPSTFWVLHQLSYPIFSGLIINLFYALSVGKIFHFILRRLGYFSRYPVTPEEKRGEFNPREVKRFPNALAELALQQVKKLQMYNVRRKSIVSFYKEAISHVGLSLRLDDPYSLLRFPMLVADKKKIKSYFAKHGIYIGDFYNQPIDPPNVSMDKVFYKKGSCPNAEKTAGAIINLPTYPTMTIKDAERVVEVLNEYKET